MLNFLGCPIHSPDKLQLHLSKNPNPPILKQQNHHQSINNHQFSQIHSLRQNRLLNQKTKHPYASIHPKFIPIHLNQKILLLIKNPQKNLFFLPTLKQIWLIFLNYSWSNPPQGPMIHLSHLLLQQHRLLKKQNQIPTPLHPPMIILVNLPTAHGLLLMISRKSNGMFDSKNFQHG